MKFMMVSMLTVKMLIYEPGLQYIYNYCAYPCETKTGTKFNVSTQMNTSFSCVQKWWEYSKNLVMLFSTRLTWQIWGLYTSQIIRLLLSTEHYPLLSDCPLLLHLAIFYNSLIIFTMTCDRSIAAHLFVLGLWNLRNDATNVFFFFSMIMAWPLLLPH